MLSGFFSRYDLGKEALWTPARFAPFNTGKLARQAVSRRAANLCLPRRWIGELEFLARQTQVIFTSAMSGKYTMTMKRTFSSPFTREPKIRVKPRTSVYLSRSWDDFSKGRSGWLIVRRSLD